MLTVDKRNSKTERKNFLKVNNNTTRNNNITHVNDVVLMHLLLTLNKLLNFFLFFYIDFEHVC